MMRRVLAVVTRRSEWILRCARSVPMLRPGKDQSRSEEKSLYYTPAGSAASRRNFADSSGGVGLM